MNTSRKNILVLIFILQSFILLGQGIIDKRPFADVMTTAQYGSGERQSRAQYELGARYFYGRYGAPQDYKESAKWYKKSAENGNQYAMYILGSYYEGGTGVERDLNKALSYYQSSASLNCSLASLKLGELYYWGSGVPRDFVKSAKYYKDAAFTGNAEAMYKYALLFVSGNGVQRDSTKAVLWANRAIEKKNYNGYWVLGQMYQWGKSVEADFSLAIDYYNQGAENNNVACLFELYYIYGYNFPVRGEASGEDPLREERRLQGEKYLSQIRTCENGYKELDNLARIFLYKGSGFENPFRGMICLETLIEEGQYRYYNKLANIYIENKEYSRAVDLYNNAAINGFPEAYAGLSVIYDEGYLGSQDLAKAIESIEKAIIAQPENLYWREVKGLYLLELGNEKEALKVWKHIISVDPNFYNNYFKNEGIKSELNEYMKEHYN